MQGARGCPDPLHPVPLPVPCASLVSGFDSFNHHVSPYAQDGDAWTDGIRVNASRALMWFLYKKATPEISFMYHGSENGA